MAAVLFLICVCGFGYRHEVCQKQNIKVSYVCYGVSLKAKGCGNVDGNGHQCLAKNKYPGCNGDYPLEMALDKAGWLFVVQGNGVACSVHSIEAPLPTWGLGDSC